MAAPEGNDFWEKRSKHGRDVLFGDPKLLWEESCEYFKWSKDNPLIEIKPVTVSKGDGMGSIVEMLEIPKMRAYSIGALCLHLGCNESYFRNFREHHLKHSKQSVEWVQDMSTVIDTIYNVIKTQQFEGATSGFLNANIISRTLGLVDKKDVTTDGEKLPATATFKVEILPPPSED